MRNFLYESFDCQKWRGREILFDKTKSSLKTTFVKTRVRCKAFCDALNVCLSGYESIFTKLEVLSKYLVTSVKNVCHYEKLMNASEYMCQVYYHRISTE